MKHVLSFIVITFCTLTFASEESVYEFSWLDKDKEVYVLQNRKFRKKSSLYLGGTFGQSVAGSFIDSTEFNLSAGFFFSEDWGIEIGYTGAQGKTNKTHDAVNTQGAVAFYRKIDTSMNAMLMWSPFYSKINTFNKIFYYDWMFGAGVTSTQTLDNRKEFTVGADSSELTQETLNGLTWMTALRFYITPNWSSRLDFRAIHLNADRAIDGEDDTEKTWSNYYSFNIGMNYAF